MMDPTIGKFWIFTIFVIHLIVGAFLAYVLVDDKKNTAFIYIIKTGVVIIGYPAVLLSIWALDLWPTD